MSDYRDIPLKDLTIEELAEAYHRACFFEKELKTPDSNIRYAFGHDPELCLERIAIDKHHIWLAMETKIPQSHIDEIRQMATPNKIKVAIGQRWMHKNIAGMVLEICECEANNPYWGAGQFLDNKFIMICKVTQVTLIANYKLLTP